MFKGNTRRFTPKFWARKICRKSQTKYLTISQALFPYWQTKHGKERNWPSYFTMPLVQDVGCATCPLATLTMNMPPRFGFWVSRLPIFLFFIIRDKGLQACASWKTFQNNVSRKMAIYMSLICGQKLQETTPQGQGIKLVEFVGGRRFGLLWNKKKLQVQKIFFVQV